MSWRVGLIVGIPAAKTPCSVSVLTHQKAKENTGREAPLTLQQMLKIHIRAPSCQRIESICKAWLWRVGCSVLQLESLLHMGKCKASAIVSSSWLLAEGMGLYRGVKVIATSS